MYSQQRWKSSGSILTVICLWHYEPLALTGGSLSLSCHCVVIGEPAVCVSLGGLFDVLGIIDGPDLLSSEA